MTKQNTAKSFFKKFWPGERKSQAGFFVGNRNANLTARNSDLQMRAAYQINSVGYTAVSQIAQKCTEFHLKVFEKTKSGKPREVKNHPALDRIYEPNPQASYTDYVTAWISYYRLDGNAYVKNIFVRDPITREREESKNIPGELWVLNPACVRPEVKHGTVFPWKYSYTENGIREEFKVDPITLRSELFHSKTFNPFCRWLGFSPIEAALYSLDQNNKSVLWNLSILENKGLPSGLITTEEELTPDQVIQLKEEVRASYQGYMGAGDPMVFQGGAKWTSESFTPEEMSWLEGLNVSAKNIALALGYPPMLLGIKGDSTYNNQESATLGLVTRTCAPLMKIFADQHTRMLLADEPEKYFEIDDSQVPELVDKRRAQNEATDKMASLTIDEKRTEMGREEYEGIGGDKILVSGGMTYLDDLDLSEMDTGEDSDELLDEEVEEETEEDDADKFISVKAFNLTSRKQKREYQRMFSRKQATYQKYIAQNFAGFFRRQGRKMASALQEHADTGATTLSSFDAVVGKILAADVANLEKVFEKNYRKTLTAFGKMIFAQAKSEWQIVETKATLESFESFVKRYIVEQSAKKIQLVDKTTRGEIVTTVRALLQEAMEDGATELQLAEQIKDVYTGFTEARARNIARTEINQASNIGSRQAVRALKLPDVTKEWIDADDHRVRDGDSKSRKCEHKAATADHTANRGLVIPFNDKFKVPGSKGVAYMDGPGDPTAKAEQICGCRCVLVYSRGES